MYEGEELLSNDKQILLEKLNQFRIIPGNKNRPVYDEIVRLINGLTKYAGCRTRYSFMISHMVFIHAETLAGLKTEFTA